VVNGPGGRRFLTVDSSVMTQLTAEAMHDIAHFLRPAHLSQLRSIIDDPKASPNDRFVALDLLRNANIAAGGVLPMCQDTGTAIVMGKKSEGVLTGTDDGEAISRGVYDAYTKLNLRYSQLAPLTMWEEKNTGTNLPAQIEIYSTPQTAVSYLEGRRVSSFLKRTDAEFWRVLDFRFVEGGPFTDDDARNASPVAVINETTRKRFFGGPPALGKTLEWMPKWPTIHRLNRSK